MSRLHEIHKGLEDVGYSGPLIEFSQLEAAVEIGQKCKEYTKLVNFLTNEIRSLVKIDEEVNAISSPEDSMAFIIEITSFLKELGCPYKSLFQGLVAERFQNLSEKFLLLDYLISELMGARILQEKKVKFKQETLEAADVRHILQALRFSRPPSDITTTKLFDKLDYAIPLVLRKAKANLVGQGILIHSLSEMQWESLREVQEDLHSEYKIRREMLLNRLDLTIQSFQWSDKTKGKEDLVEKIYYEKRQLLKGDPDVDISSLIAARTDLAIIDKTSNISVRKNTQTTLHKVTIGPLPDRGGRSWKQSPPPAEMPSWQQKLDGHSGGGATRSSGRGKGERDSAQSSRRENPNESHSNDSNKKQGSSSSRQSGGHQEYDNNRGFSNRGNNNRGHGGQSYRGANEHYHYSRRESGGGYGSPTNKRFKMFDHGGRGNYYRGRSSYYRGRVWF